MRYSEIKEIRQELEFLSTPRNEQGNQSLRIKCAERALELLEALETKLDNDNQDG
jgi:hypothetical protein